jgi:hypothetical protein
VVFRHQKPHLSRRPFITADRTLLLSWIIHGCSLS